MFDVDLFSYFDRPLYIVISSYYIHHFIVEIKSEWQNEVHEAP